MSDIYSKKKRSEIMSRISGKETTPEILVRKKLFENGYRFRKHVKSLPGKPDVVLSKYKTIIFINGCFWHGHKRCRASKLPSTNKKFWNDKIKSNISRDRKNISILKKMGWQVVVVWQCQLNTLRKFGRAIDNVIMKLETYSN